MVRTDLVAVGLTAVFLVGAITIADTTLHSAFGVLRGLTKMVRQWLGRAS